MAWKLKRTNQCKKCPWKVSTDPHEIPNGYDEELHRGLECTIADQGAGLMSRGRAMACHESPVGEEAHCVGWVANQLGPGNNLGLRIQMLSCENVGAIRLDGDQHERFEDTLP